MATKKVARSENASSTPSAGPDSERRIKLAPASKALPPEVAEAHRLLSQQDAHGIINAIRKQLAELWWYGDRTLGSGSGVTADEARDAMADLVCQIGMDLNHLGDEVDELAKGGAS